MYLEEKNVHERKVLKHVCREMYLVDNLKTKFLIKMNILDSKQIVIDIFKQKLHFEFCESIIIACEIKTRNNVRIRRTMRIIKKEVISFKTINIIFVTFKRKEHLSKEIFCSSQRCQKHTRTLLMSISNLLMFETIKTFL